jgi:hypothetical protein
VGHALMSEKGSEADIELRRLNVAEVPQADILTSSALCQKRTWRWGQNCSLRKTGLLIELFDKSLVERRFCHEYASRLLL